MTTQFKKIRQGLIASLLGLMILISGCSHSLEGVPEDLQFFTQDLENVDREKVKEAFRNLIMETYGQLNKKGEPYLISRMTRALSEEPKLDENGKLLGYQSVPVTDSDYRVVFPGESSFEALNWNISEFMEPTVTAWEGTMPEVSKSSWQPGDPASFVRTYSNQEYGKKNLGGFFQRIWLSEMFTTGVYQQTRGSKLLSYEENPAIFPSNPKYFEYSVMSAEEKYNQDASESNQEALEEDKQTEEGDFILQISTREPQNYGTNLKSANLRFYKSIGEMSSGINLVFKDYTFMQYDVTAIVSGTGMLKRVIIKENIRFTATVDKEDANAREELLTIWTIDPYPQADQKQYLSNIDEMMSSQIPSDIQNLLDPQ